MSEDPGINQLREIAATLTQSGVTWWIDSGTLLSLYRDGELFDIKLDKDFDLGIEMVSDSQLEQVAEDFSRMGYRVGTRRYRGHVVKYWMTSRSDANRRAIDLKIYRRQGDDLICPVGTVISTKPSKIDAVLSIVRKVVGFGWRRRFRKPFSLSLLNADFRIVTWVIPIRLLGSTSNVILNNVQVATPSEVDRYLSYRYGNWSEPNSNWDTLRDDGGLRHSRPESWES